MTSAPPASLQSVEPGICSRQRRIQQRLLTNKQVSTATHIVENENHPNSMRHAGPKRSVARNHSNASSNNGSQRSLMGGGSQRSLMSGSGSDRHLNVSFHSNNSGHSSCSGGSFFKNRSLRRMSVGSEQRPLTRYDHTSSSLRSLTNTQQQQQQQQQQQKDLSKSRMSKSMRRLSLSDGQNYNSSDHKLNKSMGQLSYDDIITTEVGPPSPSAHKLNAVDKKKARMEMMKLAKSGGLSSSETSTQKGSSRQMSGSRRGMASSDEEDVVPKKSSKKGGSTRRLSVKGNISDDNNNGVATKKKSKNASSRKLNGSSRKLALSDDEEQVSNSSSKPKKQNGSSLKLNSSSRKLALSDDDDEGGRKPKKNGSSRKLNSSSRKLSLSDHEDKPVKNSSSRKLNSSSRKLMTSDDEDANKPVKNTSSQKLNSSSPKVATSDDEDANKPVKNTSSRKLNTSSRKLTTGDDEDDKPTNKSSSRRLDTSSRKLVSSDDEDSTLVKSSSSRNVTANGSTRKILSSDGTVFTFGQTRSEHSSRRLSTGSARNLMADMEDSGTNLSSTQLRRASLDVAPRRPASSREDALVKQLSGRRLQLDPDVEAKTTRKNSKRNLMRDEAESNVKQDVPPKLPTFTVETTQQDNVSIEKPRGVAEQSEPVSNMVQKEEVAPIEAPSGNKNEALEKPVVENDVQDKKTAVQGKTLENEDEVEQRAVDQEVIKQEEIEPKKTLEISYEPPPKIVASSSSPDLASAAAPSSPSLDTTNPPKLDSTSSPTGPLQSESPPVKVLSDVQRCKKAYAWYVRHGMPHKNRMAERIKSGEDDSGGLLQPQDVELLPWQAGGYIVDHSKMNMIGRRQSMF